MFPKFFHPKESLGLALPPKLEKLKSLAGLDWLSEHDLDQFYTHVAGPIIDKFLEKEHETGEGHVKLTETDYLISQFSETKSEQRVLEAFKPARVDLVNKLNNGQWIVD